MTDIATLGIEVRVKNLEESVSGLNRLTNTGKQTEEQTSKIAQAFDKLGYSLDSIKSLMMQAAAAFGLMKLLNLAKDVALLSARYETLGVVMSVIGKTAGYTSLQMSEFQKGLQSTGISAIAARQSLALMGQANIDFANSTKLARIAQDAAVVGNINSSEAFSRMMTGLATGQSIILHHLGLMTNFEQAYLNAAHAMGKTTNDLTEVEKGAIRANEVIRAGAGIAGAYEAAMGTVGKQLTSLPRYFQDLGVAIGNMAQGPLFTAVSSLTKALKYLTVNFEAVSSIASTIFAGGVLVAFGNMTTKVTAYASSLNIASKQSEALRINTVFNAQASLSLTTAKAAEAEATVHSNLARVAGIDAMEAEAKANFWGTTVLKERIAHEETLVALQKTRAVAMGQLTASVTVLTAAEEAQMVAMQGVAIATTEASIAARIMTGVTNGLSTALAFVGGPIGLIAIAIAGVTYEIIRFLDRANEAQRNAATLSNQGEFAQTLQKLKEIENLNRQLENEKKSPADKAKESASQMQDKINKAVKENITLEQQRQDLLKKGQNTTASETFSGKLTEWDKVNAKIKDNNNLIQYGVRVNDELTSALKKQAELKKTLNVSPPPSTKILKLTDQQKEYESETKSFLKESWDNAATELAAEDFSRDMYKKMGLVGQGPWAAKPEGFTTAPKLSLDVDLQIKSLEQVEQSEKDRLELLRLQSKELERQQAVIKYIADLNAANSATATSMVGMNSVGGFDSIEDQTANQMAVLADAHKSRLDMIEIERAEKIASLKDINDAEKRAAEINTALNTKAELEKRKNTIATAAITDKSFKSQLSMTSQYVGMAGELFSALASTQDESSRSGFETAKAFNMAAAIMSTAAGIMAQFAAPDGALPSAWARAALVGVTGVIQVAKIASTSFGGGGGVVGAPSGSFAASGGASGTGTGLSNLPQNISSIQDSRTNESIDRLIDSTDNSALVIGKLSKSIDSLSALFDEDGGGFALANNAPNRFTQTTEIATMTGNVMNALGFGSSAVKLFKGDLLGSIKSLGSSLFGGGWQTTGAGIQLGINNGDVMARDYVTSAKSGGLFGKSKSSISYTENSDAAAYMDDLISPYISDLVNMARTLGTSVDTSKYSSAYTSIATAGRTPEAIAADMEKWFTATLQGMSLTVAGLESAIGSYDDAYEALKSMNDALVSTNEAFALVGKTALQGSFDNAKYALSLQNIFGGMDEFTTAMDDYFSAMYTDTEQAAMKAAAAAIDVNNAFAEMGLAIPSTNAAFNALRNSVTDPALFAALTLLGPTFAEMTKQSEELANVFADSLKTISQSASDAISSILNSTLSTESPEVRYARAQREFTYATPEMAGELGKSLLDASRSMFASGDGYMSDYANVMDELTTLAGLDTTVDPNASTVAEIKTLKAAIVDLQKAIVDKLTVIEAPLVRVAANI